MVSLFLVFYVGYVPRPCDEIGVQVVHNSLTAQHLATGTEVDKWQLYYIYIIGRYELSMDVCITLLVFWEKRLEKKKVNAGHLCTLYSSSMHTVIFTCAHALLLLTYTAFSCIRGYSMHVYLQNT